MILTCPNCATRYQADAAKFQPAGRNVRCAKCGHLWHQDAPSPESEAAVEFAAPEPVPPPPPPPPPVIVPPASARPQAFAPNPTIAREPVRAVAAPREKSHWPARLGVGLGWLGLIVVILLIGWSAMAFRQQIARVWPQSASIYSALGMKTDASGLSIRDTAIHRTTENGEAVLAVSGLLANNSAHELAVPQVRIGLVDDDHRELYHWKIIPNATTLRPGQTTQFSGRLTNPPSGYSHFEFRFAREGE